MKCEKQLFVFHNKKICCILEMKIKFTTMELFHQATQKKKEVHNWEKISKKYLSVSVENNI